MTTFRDKSLLSSFNAFWLQEAFLPTDTLVAAGFAYHVADIFISELERVVEEDPIEPTTAPSHQIISILLAPFYTALSDTHDDIMIHRFRSGLFRTILDGHGSSAALKNLNSKKIAEILFELGRCIFLKFILGRSDCDL